MIISKFNLLAFSPLSHSNENAAVIVFRRERILLKKEGWLWAHISISPKCFRSGFREKSALGN